MYGKVIDGKLVIAGQKIQIENGWITNPTEKQLKANGYKEISYAEKSEYDEESEKLVEKYSVKSKTIEVSYETKKLTDEEANEVLQNKIDAELGKISQLELLKAIVGDKDSISKIEGVIKTISSIENKKK